MKRLSTEVNFWRVLVLTSVVLAIALVTFHVGQIPDDITVEIPQRQLLAFEEQAKILNLSLEFGFDPLIVQVTRQLSSIAYKQNACKCATWRFVKSEDDLAYLLLSIIAIESRGNPRAINVPNGPTSGIGLTQLVLSTAREYDKSVTQEGLMTVPKHMNIAVRHFVDLLERYRGNHWLAILAWNRGIGAVERSLALGNNPSNGYAHLVLNKAAIRNAGQ